jgi:tetratricopeptide (TPR) repeat protein
VLDCSDAYLMTGALPGPRKADALRRAIAATPSGLTHQALWALWDTISGHREAAAVLCAMSAYGERLHKEGRVDLAADVHQRVVDLGRLAESFDFATAHRRLAYCLREQARLEEASSHYDRGLTHAIGAADARTAIHIMIGQAKITRMRGNLPLAASELDNALGGAEALSDNHLIALAALERGNVALDRDALIEALNYFERALQATTAWSVSDDPGAFETHTRVLTDIGVALYHLGLHDDARQVCLTVYLTAPERLTRWGAGITLIALAAADGYPDSFDHYRVALARAPMPALLRAAYHEEVGDACMAFGRIEDARRAYQDELRIGERHGLGGREFRALSALQGTPEDLSLRAPRRTDVPPEIVSLVHTVRQVGTLEYRLALSRRIAGQLGTTMDY